MGRFFTGTHGSLLADGKRIAKVTSWGFSGVVDPLETTNTGSEARTYIYGIQSYTGSCDVVYYEDDNGGIAMSTLLNNIYRTGATSATATNRLDLRAADGRELSAYVLFTNASTGATVNGVTRVRLTFQVTGHLIGASFGG